VINIMKNEDEGELSFKVGQSGSISLRRWHENTALKWVNQ
jgi:hypothetical protein